jgi:hypothetical protein
MAFDKNDHSAHPRPIGRFKQSANDVKVMDCPGGMQVYKSMLIFSTELITFYTLFVMQFREQNAVTHSTNVKKSSVTLEWFPPENYSGQVVFR